MSQAGSADVIVVGAGHNGLTAACYLAKAGLDVLVLEASRTVGGMTSTNATLPDAPAHTFNEGAIQVSLIRATPIEDELQLRRYGLKQLDVDPPHVMLDPEGPSLALWRDANRTAAELERFSKRDARAWLELSETLDTAMDVLLPFMNSHPSRPDPRRMLPGVSRAVRHPRRLAAFASLVNASMAELIDERFESRFPRSFLASLALERMNQSGSGMGVVYMGLMQRVGVSMFEGGTGALPAALHRCLLDHRGRVRTSAEVAELVVRGGRVTGVRLTDGEELEARAVVTTCSPKTTLTRLLPHGVLPDPLAARVEHIPTTVTEAASLKIDVALTGELHLPKHSAWRDDGVDLRKPVNIWGTFEEHVTAWDDVVAGRWPDPVPAIATVPTVTDPTQGPPGQDTFWLWSGVVPVHPGDPWEQARDRIGRQVIADCEDYYEGITDMEIGRRVLSAPDLSERFHAYDGNVYHVDPIRERMGPLRPAPGLGGYATPVPGLFLSGAGTHPSGGICGAPGRLAARSVMRSLQRR